ncbi:YhgE/Pip domain-containing protein [Corynebacterium timonense]|uniref:Putative membrane protein n=1 Tax=Corynebacterium timonense TaxID=441500 RepID=A0A1H1PTJ6_9CORY|nr:YhgE/Pip domain-containing protein [Corynebacterium timonense]SDS14049.1 putative membrane protein [Corynebacterium timonense]
MRTILSIAFNDLRRLYTNVMAGIVMVGLIAIPCLFAWFNILATWDPFGNTERLKVAVANTDEGHTSTITPLSVNVGDMVLSQLYRNDAMDWVITSEEDAIEGARSGEYYAAIVLPPTLSDNMLTFYTGAAEPSTIDLYVNEKKNPISPLIVSAGGEGVGSQINETFTRTLSEVAFGLIETANDFLNEDETIRALDSIEQRTINVRDQLLSGADTVDALAALTESSVPLVDGAQRIADAFDASLNQIQPADLGDLGTQLGTGAGSLGAALAATADSYSQVGDRVDELLADAGATSQATAGTLSDIAARIDVQATQYTTLRDRLNNEVIPALPAPAQPPLRSVAASLDDTIARQTTVRDHLNDAAARIGAGRGSDDDRRAIAESIGAARDAADSARQTFDTTVRPQLESLAGSVQGVQSSVDKARSDMAGVATALDNSPGSLRATLATTGEDLRSMAESMRDSAATMQDAQRSIAQARAEGDVSELADLIASRPEELADALVEPIAIDRQAVFPRASFGAGMTPLYTVIALWVGALLSAVALRTDKESVVQNVVDPEDVTTAQEYFGRYLTFVVTGLAQSTLIMGGLILYVEISPAHPFLLFVAGWVSSLVFHMICYTLVLSLSNAGKAIGVILLVLQVSAAGGAYPLMMLPEWVQNTSPWLPATYSVWAMRAAIFGTYDGDFWKAIGMLLLFTLPFLLLGLWLRNLLATPIGKMDDAVARTKVLQG